MDYDTDLNTLVAEAAKKVEKPKSPEQAEAGNYRKGHVRLHGLDIAIENPKGSYREGVGKDGNKWRSKMMAHYGYFKKTLSDADGDHVDVFIGPNPSSEIVFVVDQTTKDGKFDEHKCVFGCTSKAQARELYLSNYQKGWKCGEVTSLTMDDFKEWIRTGDTGKPMAKQATDSTEKALQKLVDSWKEIGPEGEQEPPYGCSYERQTGLITFASGDWWSEELCKAWRKELLKLVDEDSLKMDAEIGHPESAVRIEPRRGKDAAAMVDELNDMVSRYENKQAAAGIGTTIRMPVSTAAPTAATSNAPRPQFRYTPATAQGVQTAAAGNPYLQGGAQQLAQPQPQAASDPDSELSSRFMQVMQQMQSQLQGAPKQASVHVVFDSSGDWVNELYQFSMDKQAALPGAGFFRGLGKGIMNTATKGLRKAPKPSASRFKPSKSVVDSAIDMTQDASGTWRAKGPANSWTYGSTAHPPAPIPARGFAGGAGKATGGPAAAGGGSGGLGGGLGASAASGAASGAPGAAGGRIKPWHVIAGGGLAGTGAVGVPAGVQLATERLEPVRELNDLAQTYLGPGGEDRGIGYLMKSMGLPQELVSQFSSMPMPVQMMIMAALTGGAGYGMDRMFGGGGGTGAMMGGIGGPLLLAALPYLMQSFQGDGTEQPAQAPAAAPAQQAPPQAPPQAQQPAPAQQAPPQARSPYGAGAGGAGAGASGGVGGR